MAKFLKNQKIRFLSTKHYLVHLIVQEMVFVPLLKEMSKEVQGKTSNKRYVGITQPYDSGIKYKIRSYI